ncbi:MAG: L-aspartate oxidase [Candidatus Hodarchaeales archaeon]|jgi:L-aspartate oxidase
MSDETVTDILVIGSGLAGLFYALKVAKKSDYTVTIVTKRSIDETSTKYAQGGIAAVLSKHEDSFDSHIHDTLAAGDGLCRKDVAEFIIQEGPSCIQDLIDLGVEFDKENNILSLGREGGHSHRRVAHVKDTTGYAIQTALIKAVKKEPKVIILEHHAAIDLVLINGKVAGAYILDIKEKIVRNFSAAITVLATGGAGKVFLYTSNPDTTSGDGIAMAYRAGATIANMEFVQFHPTCLFNPIAKSFLVTEALRGEGAVLKTLGGKRFMKDQHPMAELAPRDIVARTIDHEMKIHTGDDFVLLDISAVKEADFIKNRFPGVYSTLLKYGIDITKEPIPVVPAAHYTIGGIRSKVNGETDVLGLLAIGEVACTGFHGANRLASNSLLEASVMAAEAAKHSINLLNKGEKKHYHFPPWESGDAVDSDEAIIVSHNWDEVRRLMWNYVGIVRSTKRLLRARKRNNLLKQEVQEYYWNFLVTNSDIIELRNIIQVAELIIDSALFRKESRGTHYTLDYPEKSDCVRDVLAQKRFGVHFSEVFYKCNET